MKFSRPLQLAFISLFVLYSFQNCGQIGAGFELSDSPSLSLGSGEMDLHHPGQQSVTQSFQSMQVANRGYVAQLLREIFTSAQYPVPELEPLILHWVGKRDAQFGLGCNPYSSYSGVDCGGDISAANLSYTMDDSALRQSYRIQACDNILGNGNAVNAALEKLSNPALAPNADGIAQVYQLFYRGDDEVPVEIIQALVEMDRSLAQNGETPANRWRALILQVCTSPGWQNL